MQLPDIDRVVDLHKKFGVKKFETTLVNGRVKAYVTFTDKGVPLMKFTCGKRTWNNNAKGLAPYVGELVSTLSTKDKPFTAKDEERAWKKFISDVTTKLALLERQKVKVTASRRRLRNFKNFVNSVLNRKAEPEVIESPDEDYIVDAEVG